MRILKRYFERRKEASVIHHLLYDIHQAEMSCYDGWFKGLNEVRLDKLGNAVEIMIRQLKEQWDEFSLEEREKLIKGGLFDRDIRYDPFEWLERFKRLLRKELKGRMFMLCLHRDTCITLWEILFAFIAFYLMIHL